MAMRPEHFDRLKKAIPDISTEPAAVRQRIEAIEMLLERSLVIPGINRSVGLDAILGLVPVVGDLITGVMGAYAIWEARNLGMSRFQMARMVGNLGVDTALGAIPFVGDAFDFFWQSNSRNLRIVKKYLDKHHPAAQIVEG